MSTDPHRSINELAPVGIFETDAAGHCTYVNQRWCEIAGMSADEALGKGWTAWLHPEDRQRIADVWYDAVRTAQPYYGEYRLQTPEGVVTWVLCRALPKRDASGRLDGYVGTVTDITALRATEGRFRLLAERASDLMWTVDPDGCFTYVSPAITELVGIPPEALLGQRVGSMMTMGSREAVDEYLRRARKGAGDEACFETESRAATGEVIHFETRAVAVRDSQGTLVSIEGVSRDITERKRAEDARTRLVTAIEQVAESITMTDLEGAITYVNPAFEETTGYAQEEVLGQNASILKGGEHDEAFYAALWKTITRGETWRGCFTNRRKDGSLFQEESVISPVRDETGRTTSFVKVGRDVTQELEQEAHLVQMQKMEALGMLAGGTAHDFNNLLSPILGYTELALQKLAPDDELARDLAEVHKAASRATDLVKRILAISRRTKAEVRPLDPKPIVTDALKFLRAALPATVEIQVDTLASVARVLADPTQLHQIVMNLCMNAGQAMPEGGVLGVQLKEVDRDGKPEGPFCDVPAGRYVRLTVRDSGAGIPADIQERIFDPYFTTKPVGEGTGLGLAIVHGVVRGLGGGIVVQSELGRGSTFHVCLPVFASGTEVSQTRPSARLRGTEAILLVDDEPSVRSVAARILRRLGYAVTLCSSGPEAVAAVRADPARFDLLLTDLTMPGMTGLQVAEAVRATRADLPIILWSGFAGDVTREKMDQVGIADLYIKPISVDRLGSMVRAVLDALNSSYSI